MKEEVILEETMEENENDGNVTEDDFTSAVVWGTDWTTETIANQIMKKNIELNPVFQRRDAWKVEEKSRLIESLMLGIPVPPIVLAEDPNKRSHYIVIDGKQRLLSIIQFYAGNEEYVQNHSEDIKYEPLKLKGLDTLECLNKMTYSQIANDNKKEKYISNIENSTIRTIVIKNWGNQDFLYNVFLRLNTGSKKLSPQELRQALKPGQFLSFLDDRSANSEPIRRMLNISAPDKRMRDVELALRYFGLKNYITEYKGDLRKFLDYTCEMLNNSWSEKEETIINEFIELENAISFSFELFEKYPFCRRYSNSTSNSLNRCIYELFTFYFSREEIRNVIRDNKEQFIIKFQKLNDSNEFSQCIDQFPKSVDKMVKRFNMFSQIIVDLDTEHVLNNIVKYKANGSNIEEAN